MSFPFLVFSPARFARRWRLLPCVCLLLIACAGCDKIKFDQKGDAMDKGRRQQGAQDFRGAVGSYENALDGTSQSAEAHFRMGIIYDQNLNDPLSAVHHFKRYIEIAPSGLHAREAKENTTRIERRLATYFNEGTLIGHAEALKLRQDNNDLRAQNTALKASLASANNALLAASNVPQSGKTADRDAQKHLPPGTRTYQVQAGDTLASISRKFYKTKDRAKDIQDANQNTISNPKKLKLGQTLIIP